MESGLVKRALLYTNRVGPVDFLELFESAGFLILSIEVFFFEGEPQEPKRYHSMQELRAGIGARRIVRTNYMFQKL
jgi:hypothetical protein